MVEPRPTHRSVAWLGHGEMGAPMVHRLREAGWTVHLLDLRDASLADQAALRGRVRGVELAVTCLPGPEDVRRAWLGTRTQPGLVDLLDAGAVLVDLSTIGPAAAQEVAQAASAAGFGAVDAPVSGGPGGAAAGTLSVMAGATSPAALAAATDLLSVCGTVHACGPAGSGQQVKLVNQSVLAGLLAGLGTGAAMTKRAGLDAALVHRVLAGGVVRGFLLDAMWPLFEAEQWTGGFAARHMVKDLGLAGEMAGGQAVPTDLHRLVTDWLSAAMDELGQDVATQSVARGVVAGGGR